MSKTYPQRIEQLDPEDLAYLVAFKQRIAPLIAPFPEMNTLWHVFRFLRSKKFDEEAALKAVRAFIDYRTIARLPEIAARPHEVYNEIELAIQVGRYGVDKSGQPIIIQRIGKTDVKQVMRQKYERLRVDYFIQAYERLLFIELPLASASVDRRVDKIVIINDFNGISMAKMLDSKLKGFMKLLVTVGQTNYPELTEHTFIVNMPSMFKGMWNMLQSWFGNSNNNRVSVHSSVPFDKLAEYMDIDKLPLFLGGKNEIPLSENHGPWKSAVDASRLRRSFFLENRDPEYKFYYTEEERKPSMPPKSPRGFMAKLTDTYAENVQSREVRCFSHSLQRRHR